MAQKEDVRQEKAGEDSLRRKVAQLLVERARLLREKEALLNAFRTESPGSSEGLEAGLADLGMSIHDLGALPDGTPVTSMGFAPADESFLEGHVERLQGLFNLDSRAEAAVMMHRIVTLFLDQLEIGNKLFVRAKNGRDYEIAIEPIAEEE